MENDWVTSESGGSSAAPLSSLSPLSGWDTGSARPAVSPFADPPENVRSLLDSRLSSRPSHHQDFDVTGDLGGLSPEGRRATRPLAPGFEPSAKSNRMQPSDIRRDALGFGEVEGRSSSDSSSMRSRMSAVPQEPVWAFSAAASVETASSRASRSEPRGSPAASTRSTSTIGSATMGAMVSLGQMPGAELPEDLSAPATEPHSSLRPFAFDQSRLSRVSSLSSSSRLTGLWAQDVRGTYRPSVGLVSPLSAATPLHRPLVINTGSTEPVSLPPISPPGDRRAAIAMANLSVWDPESPMYMAQDRWEAPKGGYYGPEAADTRESERKQRPVSFLKPSFSYPVGQLFVPYTDMPAQSRIDRPDSVVWSAPPPPQPAPPPKDPGYIPRSSTRRHSMTDMNSFHPVPTQNTISAPMGHSALPTTFSHDISPHEFSHVYTSEPTRGSQNYQPQSLPSAKGQLIWDEYANQWVVSRSRSLNVGVGGRSASTPACPIRQALGDASRLLGQSLPRRTTSTYRVSTR